ncbi:hypothetical protein [Persephonella sp.]
MKNLTLFLLFTFLLTVPSFAKDKLLIVYLYEEGSPYYEKIHNKIMKDKYLAKRIQKNFLFKEVSLSSKEIENVVARYGLEKSEGVYFIDSSTGKILYKVTDLSEPCKCANLINYFSRNLHKKNIDPDEYLVKAEKIGAYKVKVEDNYLF